MRLRVRSAESNPAVQIAFSWKLLAGRWQLAALPLLLVSAACSDAPGTDPFSDPNAPSVELVQGPAAGDTVLSFDAQARDNLGLKTVSVRLTGGVTGQRDTTFTSAVTQTVIPFRISVPRSVPPGTSVTVVAVATDGSGNVSRPDTLQLAVGNITPPQVRITSPATGTVAVIGKSLVVSIAANSALKVRAVGFVTSGSFVASDSVLFASPLRDSVSITDTLTVPSNAPAGQLVVTPFVIDSLGQRALGSAITLTVQTAAATTSTPVVSFGITPRVEVNDTIHVEATDQTGVTALGYEIRTTAGGPVVVADSITSSGNFTALVHTFTMRLPFTSFPQRIFVQAFARNANGARAVTARTDTVTVVAGITKPLPQGGAVADALYHPPTDRLYMSNIERNRLEVFNLPDTAFKTSISTGSRPWGLAPWPRDRNGTMGDTILVANSGGTSIGYIDVSVGARSSLFPSGREVFTYALPNIVAYSITSVESATAPGVILSQRTVYDFSDRPQWLAATCEGGTSTGPCGDVVVAYSTTPTGGQTLPFPNRGTLRWENLMDRSSHFFFEQAVGQTANRLDTLEVIRFAAGGVGSDSVLVPHRNAIIAPSGTRLDYSIVVDVQKLAFRDTTFTRNSGNFRRAIAAEGGSVLGSRALYFDVTSGMVRDTVIAAVTWRFETPARDRGISRATDVSDFIANTNQRVRGAAINFDGELAAIRGDSVALIDPTLRLQGLLQTSGGNPGFDFHPLNRGNGITSTRQACHSFAASTEPVIDVFENHHYSRVTTIPIRDPIIGPIRAAARGGTIVLVGATARGVVVVSLPDTFNTCP